MGQKTKIYIAGKITGDPDYRVKFADMESELSKIPGAVVINPANLPAGLKSADYARICFAMIDSSDMVVFAPDFEKSPGALLEMQYCRYIRKKTSTILRPTCLQQAESHKGAEKTHECNRKNECN